MCLLLETPQAVENIDAILTVSGIDYIHIGLNDLHLGYGMRFMFELLSDGTVEKVCNKIKDKGIPYGFGGIAKLGQGDLPAECIVAEHYRLGSSMSILSRSFCNTNNVRNNDELKRIFEMGINELRDYEQYLLTKSETYFEQNVITIKQKVMMIVNSINKGKGV